MLFCELFSTTFDNSHQFSYVAVFWTMKATIAGFNPGNRATTILSYFKL